ncbi:aldose epimerase family protein [Thalassospira marina]|uniref:Aldose 1-epimerase n=1 Tax=Thalassospira marina TaxID=2048283 RepID=A0A2N3KYD9_9PROT|nr:aldose epimerase family protein [Thalassospira marina]PKR55585.1 galactose-1-epimerase [Thalassospira marina]
MTAQHAAQTITTLENQKIRARFCNQGARIMYLGLKNEGDDPVNIALGFSYIGDYARQDSYIGATCGRYANRIAKARYDNHHQNTVQLAANEGENLLHGGPEGFDRRIWMVMEETASSVVYALSSPDGDQGFPGNLHCTVRYELAGNSLRCEISATCDAPTIVNMTNHSYWNLSGRFDGSAADHELQIHADQYLPVDDGLIPLPGRAEVTGTTFDFRTPRAIASPEELQAGKIIEYDHNFCLSGRRGTLRKIASLFHASTNRRLTLSSTEAGLQFYLARHFTPDMTSQDGKSLHPQCAIALEPQTFPDSPNRDDFPSPFLNPGDTYSHVMVWQIEG